MIWILMAVLSVALMLPLLLVFRSRGRVKNRRETAMNLHRAQLDELTRDLEDGRIGAPEYAGAKLEVERRLLTADTLSEPESTGNAKWLLVAVVILVPVMAFMLYLPGSTPDVPSEPHAAWMVKQQQAQAQIATLITELRVRLANLDPNSPEASEGQAYLAEALAEQAGQLTPESIALFKQSIANAPPNASWRALDEQRLVQAAAQQ
ncbi:MAG: c-type cytochrome biogenesis protein CcmI [Acidocella sp.]|nr:c-type cytochrome biogenesis protein CcmI [Acidocella sp.]